MNGRNDEVMGFAVIVGIVALVVQIVFAVVAAVAIFATMALGIVAFIAIIRDGVTINGEYVSKADGQAFFCRGFVGAIISPIVVFLVVAILGWHNPVSFEHAALAGFIFGALGGEYDDYEKQKEAEDRAALMREIELSLPPYPAPGQTGLVEYFHPVVPTQPVTRDPFQFASWEDEETRR